MGAVGAGAQLVEEVAELSSGVGSSLLGVGRVAGHQRDEIIDRLTHVLDFTVTPALTSEPSHSRR